MAAEAVVDMVEARPRRTDPKVVVALAFVLVLEIALVVSLRRFGWAVTGSVLQFTICLIVAGLPLIVATAIFLRRGLRFSVRSVLLAVTLLAVFFSLSWLPLVRHRAARQTSMRLLAANATLNEGLDWNDFYPRIRLQPPPQMVVRQDDEVPLWLTAFTGATERIPLDHAVSSVWLDSDDQCRILAGNWERLGGLQSVSIGGGVTAEGLRLLKDVLPRFQHLEMVHVNSVVAPEGWYRSLTNVRMLWVWGENALRGTKFNAGDLRDIADLPDLEVFMVLGYAFGDGDARQLATSRGIKRVILRGTDVTQAGEADLTDDDRIVFRN